MFQVTRKADYAVRVLLELASRGEETCIPTQVIAEAADIPQPFLHKIARDLVTAGLVRTQAGPNGGLVLSKPTQKINLLQIFESVEGPICLNVCLHQPANCSREMICPAHSFWGKLQGMVINEMKSATLDKLLDDHIQKKDAVMIQ